MNQLEQMKMVDDTKLSLAILAIFFVYITEVYAELNGKL